MVAHPSGRGAVMVTFIDDDPAFVRWRDIYPDGYIVNHDREPKRSYLKLHRATCSTLQGVVPGRGDNWTVTYAKTCSENINELDRWALSLGGELEPCRS
jgi:hypothetical protein